MPYKIRISEMQAIDAVDALYRQCCRGQECSKCGFEKTCYCCLKAERAVRLARVSPDLPSYCNYGIWNEFPVEVSEGDFKLSDAKKEIESYCGRFSKHRIGCAKSCDIRKACYVMGALCDSIGR